MTLGFIDPTWFYFMIPGLIIGMIAQFKLKSTYAHYVQQPAAAGITGAQAAREILNQAGLQGVPIEEVPGHLTDHYDPIRKKLCLSSENFHGRSIAALGVAAHEAGHALQHKAAYAPLNIRMAIVPLSGIGSSLGFWLVIIGAFWGTALGVKLAWLGIALFGMVVLFQVVTLPVEYDASRRAKEQLLRLGLVSAHEHTGVGRVLNAAALTYVAAMVTAVLQLFYLLSIVNRR
jgi:uncharacterized protein